MKNRFPRTMIFLFLILQAIAGLTYGETSEKREFLSQSSILNDSRNSNPFTNLASDSVMLSWCSQDTTVPFIKGSVISDIILDSDGNSYVTGKSFSPDNENNIATAKYDADGNRLWLVLFDGPDHESDEARKITLDPSGNVIVAGFSKGATTGSDYLIIKYSPEGEALWDVRYDGPEHLADIVTDLVVNEEGDIFVSGFSEGEEATADYLTIKYNSEGSLIWTARYDSPGSWDDRVCAMALVSSEQVVVTGTSESPNSSCFTTVLYDASGEQVWVSRYRGESGSFHHAIDLVVDGPGNIYVTGDSEDSLSVDFATIKIDPDGNTLWTARYNAGTDSAQPTRIICDQNNNIYITGFYKTNETSYDFATVKYNPDGEMCWAALNDGQGDSRNRPNDLAIDSAYNLYITGYSCESSDYADFLTLKYDSSGNEIWKTRFEDLDYPYLNDEVDYQATSVAVSPNGNLIIAGNAIQPNGSSRWYITKNDSSGNLLWSEKYIGSGYRMTFYCAMQQTPSGNVAVAVSSYAKGNATDCLTQLYDPDGNRLWNAWYNGSGNSYDTPVDMATDSEGNIYITGSSMNADNSDVITIKYSPLGEELWASNYNSPANSTDNGRAIAVNAAGQAYITGSCINQDSNNDYITIKYSPSGDILWTAQYNSPANSSDYGKAIAVDASGSVYVAGECWTPDSGNDLVIVKYSAAGELLWETSYNNPANSSDNLIDMALDSDGNLYVSGCFVNSSGEYQYVALKLNSGGDILWNMIPDFNGYSSAMYLDSNGQLYLTGSAYINPDHGDYAIVKLNSDGELLWQVFSERLQEDMLCTASAITLDESGNIYITGRTNLSDVTDTKDLLLAKYSPAGELLWITSTSSGNDCLYQPRSIVVDSDQNIYVATWLYSSDPPLLLVLQQYCQVTTAIDELDQASEKTFSLDPAYPNPFNPVTTISFTLPSSQGVSLKIYDVLGREVTSLVSGKLEAGKHSVQWQAKGVSDGVYFYRLKTTDWTQTGKLILVK